MRRMDALDHSATIRILVCSISDDDKGVEPGGGLHTSFPGFIDACRWFPAVCCLGMMCEEIGMGTL